MLINSPPPSTARRRPDLAKDFSLEEGGQQHFFTMEPGEAESQVVVNPESRVIAAFPADNTGVSVWFEPGAEVTATGEPASRSGRDWQEVAVPLHSHQPCLEVSQAILGSIRTIREQLQDTGEVERIAQDSQQWAQRFGAPAAWVDEQARLERRDGGLALTFTRTERDGRPYQARLVLPADVTVQNDPDGWRLSAPRPFDFTLQARVPRAPIGGYRPEQLFSPAALDLLDRLQGDPREERCLSSMKSLMFLARQGKFMAGSWRFMTYFGRDTMLSLMLLQPALTSRAYCDGLQSVLDRLSPQGVVAHEEDLGPWAEQRRIHQALEQQARPALAAVPAPAALAGAALSEPIYDYKMVDDDFLLPLATERLVSHDPKAGADFMTRGDNLTRLVSNWQHVMARAEPLLQAGNEPWRAMVRIHEGENVGDWRDSNEGLGWGKYPGSVNVDLVAASLGAIEKLAARVPPEPLREACRQAGHPELFGKLSRLGPVQKAWEGARESFRVHLDAGEVRERLRNFFASAPLTAAETTFYLNRPVGEGGPTLGAFLQGGAVPPALESGLDFMALSLDGDGRKVEIPNSDASFRLFLGEPPRRDVEDVLKLLELEYPVGLMTAVGPVVADAAYSRDPRHHRELDRQGYHGAVIWSWQSAMLQAGLVRQRERFHDQPELVARLDAALRRLQTAEQTAGPLATSELWTHEVVDGQWKAAPWGGQAAAGGDESNAAQLWSTVYPAVLMQTSA